MNIQDDKTDIKFRKLFEKAGLESPSDGFTGDVMKKINALNPEAEPVKKPFKGWLGGLGIALLTIVGISIMYYFGINVLPAGFKSIFAPVFENTFSSFRGIFDSVEISATTVAIILGFAFLVILERVLNRFRSARNIYFSL